MENRFSPRCRPRSGRSATMPLAAGTATARPRAALNQFVHSAAIELARKRPEALCVALHPGTVDTGLSLGLCQERADGADPRRKRQSCCWVSSTGSPRPRRAGSSTIAATSCPGEPRANRAFTGGGITSGHDTAQDHPLGHRRDRGHRPAIRGRHGSRERCGSSPQCVRAIRQRLTSLRAAIPMSHPMARSPR